MKVVVNRCYGGFGLSEEAETEFLRRKGITAYHYSPKKGYNMRQVMSVPESKFRELQKQFKNNPKELNHYYLYDKVSSCMPRNDADLIAVVESMGSEKASGDYAELRIVEIPDDIEWEIDEYDGMEKVREKHRSW